MDQERERIKDDLRGLVKGDVRCDDVFLQLYASDASIFEIRPMAVVRPRSLADVVAVVRYAAENKLPIHPRGAGTGLAGESLGAGIVVDFSRYMRRILDTDADSVRLQPGVVHARLNNHLRPLGRQFGPDPAMSIVTTMGSVVAIDAGGSHWLKYGSARQHVRSLQIVLADGQVMEVGREPVAGPQFDSQSPRGRLVTELADLILRHRAVIEAHQPKSLVNRCGYQLRGVLGDQELDLPKLLSGSEGTLALITEIVVATQPLPRHRGVVLLLFDRLENAARAATETVPLGPSACDLMDRRHLSLARESAAFYDQLIPTETEAVLLVEFEGETITEVRNRMLQIIDRVRRKKRLAFHALQTQDRVEMEWYRRLAQKVVPTLYRMKGPSRPIPFIEDLAVPLGALADFLVRMQNVLKQHEVTASLFAHAGHGQLHIRPFLDLSDPVDAAKMAPLAIDLYREVLDVGGTISGEHADGLSRTAFIRQQYGPLADVFVDVKRIFDPQNLLNPGKIVHGDPDALVHHHRAIGLAATAAASAPAPVAAGEPAPEAVPASPIQLQLRWTAAEVAEVARDCNGCGACRSQLSDVRMCPIFRLAPAEESSPRAKANVMRAVLSGKLDPATLASEEFKAVADLCVNCKMCRLECPASIDIPRLMIEGKGAYVRVNGLSTSDWVMSRIDWLSAIGSMFRPVANWAVANRGARWLIEKTLGIAQGRKLPRFAARSFLRVAARRRLTRATRRSGRKVLYFVDTYANYHDPQLGEALVEVMQHNGIAVYVHPGQTSSAMPLISLGALGRAQTLARRNIALLAEAVRQGYQIVTTEPSAALALREEYPALVDDDDARVVAENTSEACTYLWKLHETGGLQLDLRPVNATIGYHMPCHLRALQVGSPGESLLRLIPGLVVQRLESGCSGMAGTFGLKRENYRASLRAGLSLIRRVRDPAIQVGATECSTCKLQMEQGTHKATIHPLKILALAYGLMPEAADLFALRNEELVVT
jgi:anaerobic glycerol-3-phosphate dehydrogenase C subunit